MDCESFRELLDEGKLLDVHDHPLRLWQHPSEDTGEGDTFFRCVSVAMYGHPGERIALRAACVLRFIRVMFYRMGHVHSVQQFLDEYSEEARISRVAHREEAIQAWLCRYSAFKNVSVHTLFTARREHLKQSALSFIRANNHVGVLTCRFTFSYLLASLYRLQVHLYDQLREDGEVHIQPSIRVEPPRLQKAPPPWGHPPPQEEEGPFEEETEDMEKELHIYIWYTSKHFQLLVPQTQRILHKSRLSVLRSLHMQRQPLKYELRKSLKEECNVSVCKLRPVEKNSSIHFCTLSKAQLQENPEAIYMLFPCDGRLQLDIPEGQHLFVYCVRESEVDVRPRIECLVELLHDLPYPFFLLPLDTRHVIVTVSSLIRDNVLRQIAPYFLKQ